MVSNYVFLHIPKDFVGKILNIPDAEKGQMFETVARLVTESDHHTGYTCLDCHTAPHKYAGVII